MNVPSQSAHFLSETPVYHILVKDLLLCCEPRLAREVFVTGREKDTGRIMKAFLRTPTCYLLLEWMTSQLLGLLWNLEIKAKMLSGHK